MSLSHNEERYLEEQVALLRPKIAGHLICETCPLSQNRDTKTLGYPILQLDIL
jgi:hypothetical protein